MQGTGKKFKSNLIRANASRSSGGVTDPRLQVGRFRHQGGGRRLLRVQDQVPSQSSEGLLEERREYIQTIDQEIRAFIFSYRERYLLANILV